jgi:hypothetical protein
MKEIEMSKKPHTVVLLDESGSMSGVRDSVINTFNEFVNSVRDSAKTVSLYTFDSSGIRERLKKVPVKEVRQITTDDYNPRAMTPLYDSMANVMNRFDNSERPVQFVVHTDGAENYSKEYTFNTIDAKIKQKTKDGWLFVFLGEGLEGQATLKNFEGVKVNFTNNAMRGQSMDFVAGATAMYSDTGSTDARSYTKNGTDTISVD